MELLTLPGAGLLTWSNSKKNSCLFATANIYDSFSQSFDNPEEGLLQIYSFDLMNRTSTQQKLGVAKIQGYTFTSLDWEAYGENDKYPYGIIASGFSNGAVALWDVNQILSARGADTGQQAYNRGLLCMQEVHSAPVSTIAFNPFKQHLIASGGSEVVIHDIEGNINDPEVFSPGDNLHQGSAITAVSWNRKVPHILASASQNGVSVVWDLKINKAIFNFSDHNKTNLNRNVSLSWNPEIPTQIGVVYDDERIPELQIWDLRNPQGPIFASNKGHVKGIHSMDWCLTDPSLIVTMGRDNKLTFWNYKSAENDHIVSEKSLAEAGIQVKMSPRLPAIYSVSTASGNSTIYTLNDDTQIDSQLSSYAPRWLKPPVGARFSFDGRLAVFSEKGGVSIKEYKVSLTDERIEPYLADFERNFSNPKLDVLELCESRVNSDFLDEADKQEWKFIKAIAHDDPDEIISVLGLDKAKIIKKTEDYTGKIHSSNVSSKKKTTETSYKPLSATEAEDFFTLLATKDHRKKSIHLDNEEEKPDNQFVITETVQRNTNWDAGVEKIIKDNILVGNIEGAVDSALKNGRTAEALLLAYFKGQDFFRATIKQYFTSCHETFVKNVMRCLVEGQIGELVKNHPLDSWKECVALCLSYTGSNRQVFQGHMEELAIRFINERNDHSTALFCYILSKNFSRILENLAFRTESYIKGSLEYVVFLMRTLEKLTALRVITGSMESHPIVDRFVYELSKTLHSYGRDAVILNLITINDCRGFECSVIRDRILHSTPDLVGFYSAKPFPFRSENVNIKSRKGKVEPTPKMGGAGPGQPKQIEKKPIFDPRASEKELTRPPMDLSKTTPFKPPVQGTGPKMFDSSPSSNTNPLNTPPTHGKFVPPKDPNFPKPMTPFNPAQVKKTEESKGLTSTESDLPRPPTGGFPKGNIPPPKKDIPTFTQAQPSTRLSQTIPETTNKSLDDMPPPKMTSTPFGGKTSAGMNESITNTTTTSNLSSPMMKTPPPNKMAYPTPTNPMMNRPGPMTTQPPTSNPTTTSGPFQNPTNNQITPPPFGRPNISNPNVSGPNPLTASGGFKGPMNQPKTIPKPNIPTTTTSSTSLTQNVQSVNPSDIPSYCSHIYATLTRGMALLDQIDKNPRKKMETEQKMNSLWNILINGTMKESTFMALSKLCEELDAENFEEARAQQEKIAKEDWDANKDWLNTVRRIILRK